MKISMMCLLFLICGCNTIHVKNGSDAQLNYTQDEWHHIGVFSLVEFSPPVDLNNRCQEQDWSAIRTRQSPVQVILGLIPYVGMAYSPMEVSVACKAK